MTEFILLAFYLLTFFVYNDGELTHMSKILFVEASKVKCQLHSSIVLTVIRIISEMCIRCELGNLTPG